MGVLCANCRAQCTSHLCSWILRVTKGLGSRHYQMLHSFCWYSPERGPIIGNPPMTPIFRLVDRRF